MNKLTIIGNLTRDPDLRATSSGISVCSFTVAVNRKKANEDGSRDADFFKVTAWRQLGENCAKFLAKGRKVCVVGPVSVSTYEANDGTTRFQLEVTAEDVEFLSARGENENTPAYAAQAATATQAAAATQAADRAAGFTAVETDELPF